MASGSGSSGLRHDPAWKYCYSIEGNKYDTKCSFCGLVIQSGGITRFKYHLSHTDPNSNTKKCPNVPPEVKEEIKELICQKMKAKQKKAAMMENIRTELRGNLGGSQRHTNMDEDDEEIYMYPTDMNPDEREDYQAAVRASRESEWQRQQQYAFFGSKGKTGNYSGSGHSDDTPSQLRRTQSMRPSAPTPPIAPSLYKTLGAKQKNIKDMFKGGNIKETMGRLVSKFFIYDSVPPNKASSHHFKNMILGAQQAGMGIPSPSPHEIKNKYLEMEYKEMKAYVDAQREKWKTYGCTIMCDGWTGPTKLSIINFMVYCKGNTVFLKSVDASN